MDLNLIWFGLLGVLLIGYAILDGFDLGVGILHPLARTDQERRLFINAIGPIWDGNEVWLITFGGALFAMFPLAYATIFSGFYVAFMALLAALILRAVSLEFRSKLQPSGWRSLWDGCFFAGSAIASLLFGVAVGNAMIGIPLTEDGEFSGSFFDLLGFGPNRVSVYPLLVGMLTLAMFAMHGAIYLYLKTEGAVQDRLHNWIWHTWGTFLVLYMLTTIYTLAAVPTAVPSFQQYPWAGLVVVVSVLAIANVPRAVFLRKYWQAFISSSLTIASLIGLFALALFPNLVRASNPDGMSLTIYNAASSPLTMKIGLIIVIIGMPFVLAYTTAVYWTFRGKVRLDSHSY